MKRDEFIQTILSMIFAILTAGVVFAMAFFFGGCKPSMPQRTDYPSMMYPCYLADVCVRMPAYAQQNPVECGLAIQKCFRYTDYDKCRDADNSEKCLDFMGIRL
jgi:hypothetical protein